MQAIWIRHQSDRVDAVSPLPLRMKQYGKVLDAEPYRRQARGEDSPPAQDRIECIDLRTISLRPGESRDLFEGAGVLLNFVIEGTPVLTAGGREHYLHRGDLFLADDNVKPAVDGGEAICRLLQLRLKDSWRGSEADVQPAANAGGSARDADPLFTRMFEGPEGRSHFKPLDIFPAPGAGWSRRHRVAGLRFVNFEDGCFIDWHPEVVNNLVIVLSGEIELEVGGSPNGIQVFRPGDICLAEDRTGEGHIDRMIPKTLLALLVIDTEDLW